MPELRLRAARRTAPRRRGNRTAAESRAEHPQTRARFPARAAGTVRLIRPVRHPDHADPDRYPAPAVLLLAEKIKKVYTFLLSHKYLIYTLIKMGTFSQALMAFAFFFAIGLFVFLIGFYFFLWRRDI